MAAIPLAKAPLAALKKLVLDDLIQVKSSHVTEALAAALGFRTHAALQAAMTGPEEERPFVLLDTDSFLDRIRSFGYELSAEDARFDFELFGGDAPIVRTMPSSAFDIEYKTARDRAWRNLMVLGVNAALDQRLFSLRPGDDRFDDTLRRGHLFDFVLPNGLPARGSVATAGFDELALHVAVNPKGENVRFHSGGFSAGDAFGTTWLERRNGAWLQSTPDGFRCRKALLPVLAELDAQPRGYGDRGKLIM
jgi:hypothetical protein